MLIESPEWIQYIQSVGFFCFDIIFGIDDKNNKEDTGKYVRQMHLSNDIVGVETVNQFFQCIIEFQNIQRMIQVISSYCGNSFNC